MDCRLERLAVSKRYHLIVRQHYAFIGEHPAAQPELDWRTVVLAERREMRATAQ